MELPSDTGPRMLSCARRAKKAGNLVILSFLLLGFRAESPSLVCTFVDQEGDPLESVETQLIFQDAEDEEEAVPHQKSDADGRVEFMDLRPVGYVLQAQLEGYMPFKLTIQMPAAEHLHRILLKEKEFEDLENKAVESLNSQDFETAIRGLEGLLHHYPEDAALHDNLARAFAGILDEERALAEAERAAELDPDFSSTSNEVQQLMLRTFGETALKERDFKTAVARFTALRELDPENPAAHEGLALAYGHQGKLEEALDAIGRAVELDPDNPSFQKIKEVLEINAGIREP